MRKGFTLAEVLITLGVIGTISALTLPAIVRNYRYEIYSASLKKAYAQITEATQAVMAEELTSKFYETKASMRMNCNLGSELGACYFLRKYFKVRHECVGHLNTKCLAASYKSTSGADAGVINTDRCIQTTGGLTICHALNPMNKQITLFIDTNGPAEPNTTGVDTFIMDINKIDGHLTDWSADPNLCNTKVSAYGMVSDYATGCLTKAMRNNWKIEPED